MRLINCKSFQLEEFLGSNIPPYAILSHTWESEETGYQKIEYTCHQATKDELQYAWVDTICIDKSSSAELSEATNSMFRWYRKAKVCYAYLSDVTCTGFVAESCKSRWFTRGWTLQELIAPFSVTFYDKNWQDLGSKRDHARLISEITTIDRSFLVQASHFEHERPFNRYSVAKRMAWAAQRQTTRIEDMAYCLLGLFNVKIPLLYVEGEKAFVRLQEEIIQANDDVSIFAWGVHEEIFESPQIPVQPGAGFSPFSISHHRSKPSEYRKF
ncbi:HET-domain-containing protein [Phaeosphaeriaceae sp. SRC1lsM3a]|nr:HET-domain-containing protein [Stagonospora sp. SRC1lsM3a]